ncbi:MAG: hypothetical protein ACU843_04780 [Gammaproteobacteria bacterium]
MEYLDNFIEYLKNLGATYLTDPFASALAGALLGAFVILVLAMLVRRRNKKKSIRLQEEMIRKYASLQESLSVKTANVATLEQTCMEQREALSRAHEQIAQLEEVARKTPILEDKIEQQLRQIEALTETIVSELATGYAPEMGEDRKDLTQLPEPLGKEAVIDYLGARLYEQLSTLHHQIADQSHLVVELQAELNAKKESVAKQMITKGQQLPKIAKSRFEEGVVEPIQIRIDRLKQNVQAIPEQTRATIDHWVLDPVHRRVAEIKSGLSQIPAEAASQLNKIVVDPLNGVIQRINDSIKTTSSTSQAKFNVLVTGQLQNLLGQLRASGQKLSGETREYLNRFIIKPLEQLLAEIRKGLAAIPDLDTGKFNEMVVKPIVQNLRGIPEHAKQALTKGIKNAESLIMDSLHRTPPTANATT